MSIGTQTQQICKLLTEHERQYLIEHRSDCRSMSAIAETYGVARSTVWRTIKRADKKLRAAGIIPPDEPEAGLKQKGESRVRTVDPHDLDWVKW